MLTLKKLALLLALVATTFTVGCSSSNSDKKADQPTTETSVAVKKVINLFNQDFTPKTLTVSPGEAVTFVNSDREPRNVSISALNVDETLQPNGEWVYTFNVAGEYAGYDRLTNGKPTFTVVVQ